MFSECNDHFFLFFQLQQLSFSFQNGTTLFSPFSFLWMFFTLATSQISCIYNTVILCNNEHCSVNIVLYIMINKVFTLSLQSNVCVIYASVYQISLVLNVDHLRRQLGVSCYVYGYHNYTIQAIHSQQLFVHLSGYRIYQVLQSDRFKSLGPVYKYLYNQCAYWH